MADRSEGTTRHRGSGWAGTAGWARCAAGWPREKPASNPLVAGFHWRGRTRYLMTHGRHASIAGTAYKAGRTKYLQYLANARSKVSQFPVPSIQVRRSPIVLAECPLHGLTHRLADRPPRYRGRVCNYLYVRTAIPDHSVRSYYMYLVRILHLQRPCTASASA